MAWNREALLAIPALEAFCPALHLCPADRFPSADDLTAIAQERRLTSGSGAPLRFVGASVGTARGFEAGYEMRIFRDGEVPTRSNDFHDLFNALAWITYPRTKALLNRLHYEHVEHAEYAIAQQKPSGRIKPTSDSGSRGTARDVLTLFDESGIVVACGESELAGLLRDFQWKALFCEQRDTVKHRMRFLSFGHAMLEKAMQPYKGITARALIISANPAYFNLPIEEQIAEADSCAALHLSPPAALEATDRLAPLPILGIPGWCTANRDASFYDDTSVFRPGRRARLR
jgi:hypothetical protein